MNPLEALREIPIELELSESELTILRFRQRPESGYWRQSARLLRCLPDFLEEQITEKFRTVQESSSYRTAYLLLKDVVKSSSVRTLSLGDNEKRIATLAYERASLVRFTARSKSPEVAIQGGIILAKRELIRIGEAISDIDSEQGLLARLGDQYWWRKQLRKASDEELERFMRDSGRVHARAQRYISDRNLERQLTRQRRNRSLIQAMVAVNELGEEVSLEEIVDASLANPKNRRSELMARIAGFEVVSLALGHVGEFYTLTTPSRMHARLSRSGAPNPKYDGTSPRDAQLYLRDLWSRIRAMLLREGIRVYGFRIAEPHHDGTPHWHFLLFMPTAVVPRVRSIFKTYALATDGTEPGAQTRRFQAKAIDPNKGSATGYLVKYVAKNIDGHALPPSRNGIQPDALALRVRAYASTWRLRQFQQIGGPPVGIYRELRRLASAPTESLEGMRVAADAGNWGEFVSLLGGPLTNRSELTLSVIKVPRIGCNRYGDPLAPRIEGLNYRGIVVLTRFHTWQLRTKPMQLPGHDPP